MNATATHRGQKVHFSGADAARRRLESAHLKVGTLTAYKSAKGGLGSVWEASTSAGQRWVLHDADGWRILKAPPGKCEEQKGMA